MNFKKRINGQLLGIALLLIGFVYFAYTQIGAKEESDVAFQEFGVENPKEEVEKQDVEIFIDIKGAISNEGVYPFVEGDRVKDAIEKAGGLLPNAEKNSVNFAQILEDEMVLYIPVIGEVEKEVIGIDGVGGVNEKDGKININKADSTMLQTIPGIGPAKAQDILSYREQNGPFKSIEDLQKVNGIGEKTVEKLRPYVEIK